MEIRYEVAPQIIIDLVNSVIEASFPALIEAKMDVIYNMKKKASGGNIVVGEMKKSNELIRHYTQDNKEYHKDGTDYMMILDGTVFPVLDEADQIRIIRHELQHCEYDGTVKDDKNPWKICPHEIEDFHAEITYNVEDPRWKERVLAVAEALYEEEEE